MAILLDTNILLPFAVASQSRYEEVRKSVGRLAAKDPDLVIAQQNLVEAWAVATRPPRNNGLGLDLSDAAELITEIRQAFRILPEHTTVFGFWFHLVTTYRVSGIRAHDARLAAIMLANEVTSILTYNTRDFEQYRPEGIVVLNLNQLSD